MGDPVNPNRSRALRLLAGGLIGAGLATLGATVALWVARGPSGAVSALVTAVVVIGFFSLGQGLQAVVADASPQLGLVVALSSYLLRVVLLGVVVLGVLGTPDGMSGVDRLAVVVATIVVVVGWVSGEVAAYHKLRIPVYDSVTTDPPAAGPR